jgi:hypothetical protein
VNSILELQVKTSKMLAFGFTLTMVGLYGVGSFIAFILGLRGRRIIQQSNGQVGGRIMAWWCIIVGALETLLAIPVMLLIFLEWLE